MKSPETDKHGGPPGNRLQHLLALAGLLLLAYLAFNGSFSRITDSIGGSHMDGVNRTYLESAGQSATDLLEVLSVSKVALALLKSSEGGISFFIDVNIQLGESLSVIYDMVNYAWLSSVAALAATKGLELFLDLSRLSMAPALTLFFCVTGLYVGLRGRFPGIALALSEVARLTLLAVLLLHFVAPLSVYGLAAAGHHFFKGHKTEVHEGFSSIQTALPRHDPETGLHSQVEGSIKHFKDHQGTLHKSASSLSSLTAKHIVLVLAEYLFMPLILFYALSSLALLALKRLWARWEDHAKRQPGRD